MRNQESCVSTFADENMFETEEPENNLYVIGVTENLEEQGHEDVDIKSVNQAFITYFYREELTWTLDNDWGSVFNYMTDVGWTEAQSLERIVDYLEKQKASAESLKYFLSSDDHELDTDDEEIREQMERLGL